MRQLVKMRLVRTLIVLPITATFALLCLSGCAPPLDQDETYVGITPQEEYEQETPVVVNTDPKSGVVIISDGEYNYEAEVWAPYITAVCYESKLIFSDENGQLYIFPDDPACVG